METGDELGRPLIENRFLSQQDGARAGLQFLNDLLEFRAHAAGHSGAAKDLLCERTILYRWKKQE